MSHQDLQNPMWPLPIIDFLLPPLSSLPAPPAELFRPSTAPFSQVQASGSYLGGTAELPLGDPGRWTAAWGKGMHACKRFQVCPRGPWFAFFPLSTIGHSSTKRGEKSRDLEPPLRMCKRLIYWEQRVSNVIPMQLNPLGHSEFSLLQLPDCHSNCLMGV